MRLQEPTSIFLGLAGLRGQRFTKWMMTFNQVGISLVQTLQQTKTRHTRPFSINPTTASFTREDQISDAVQSGCQPFFHKHPWEEVIDIRQVFRILLQRNLSSAGLKTTCTTSLRYGSNERSGHTTRLLSPFGAIGSDRKNSNSPFETRRGSSTALVDCQVIAGNISVYFIGDRKDR